MKNYIRILAMLIALSMLCCACSTSDSTEREKTTGKNTETKYSSSTLEDGPWIPDVNTTLGVDGEYQGEDTGSDGITYVYYFYEFKSDEESVGSRITAYTEALKELGFEAKKLTADKAVWCESYTKDEYRAELTFYVTDGAKEIANGGSGKWMAVLAYQKGMTFEPGSGTPGVRNGETVCVGCNGTGKCAQCVGSGTVDRETCVVCNGTGICTVCDGKGTY